MNELSEPQAKRARASGFAKTEAEAEPKRTRSQIRVEAAVGRLEALAVLEIEPFARELWKRQPMWAPFVREALKSGDAEVVASGEACQERACQHHGPVIGAGLFELVDTRDAKPASNH